MSGMTYSYRSSSPLDFLTEQWQSLEPIELVDIGAPRLVDSRLMDTESDIEDVLKGVRRTVIDFEMSDALFWVNKTGAGILSNIDLPDDYADVLSPVIHRLRSVIVPFSFEMTEAHAMNMLDYSLWAGTTAAIGFSSSAAFSPRVNFGSRSWRATEAFTPHDFFMFARQLNKGGRYFPHNELTHAFAFRVANIGDVLHQGQTSLPETQVQSVRDVVNDSSALSWLALFQGLTDRVHIPELAAQVPFAAAVPYVRAGIHDTSAIIDLYKEGIDVDLALIITKDA